MVLAIEKQLMEIKLQLRKEYNYIKLVNKICGVDGVKGKPIKIEGPFGKMYIQKSKTMHFNGSEQYTAPYELQFRWFSRGNLGTLTMKGVIFNDMGKIEFRSFGIVFTYS